MILGDSDVIVAVPYIGYTTSLALPLMSVTSSLSCSPREIIDVLGWTKGQGWGAGRRVCSGSNDHVSSLCVDAVVQVTLVAEKAI